MTDGPNPTADNNTETRPATAVDGDTGGGPAAALLIAAAAVSAVSGVTGSTPTCCVDTCPGATLFGFAATLTDPTTDALEAAAVVTVAAVTTDSDRNPPDGTGCGGGADAGLDRVAGPADGGVFA